MKVCQGEIYDLKTRFKSNVVEGYKVLLNVKHDSIITRCLTNLNINIEHLAFDVNQQHIWATHLNMKTSEVSYVTREVYAIIITQVEA
jgi:hypothetical protein